MLLAWESAKEADVLDEVRPAIETLLAHDASWPFAGWFVRLAWLQLEAGEPETATATLRSGLPAIARSREGMVKKLAAAAKALADRGLTADDLPTLASWVEELEAARGPGGTTP